MILTYWGVGAAYTKISIVSREIKNETFIMNTGMVKV